MTINVKQPCQKGQQAQDVLIRSMHTSMGGLIVANGERLLRGGR
jgi:hypothetical protein